MSRLKSVSGEKQGMAMILYMLGGGKNITSIMPWVSGAVLILISTLLSLRWNHYKELVFICLWTLPLLVASYCASCYSSRHKLLAGLSYLIFFPLLLTVVGCLNGAEAGIISLGWIDGFKEIIRFFCIYLVIGCIPVFTGTMLGLGVSRLAVGAFGDPHTFGLFLVTATLLVVHKVGILFDIKIAYLLRSVGMEDDFTISTAMTLVFFILPFALASLFAASYIASCYSRVYGLLAWLWYVAFFPFMAILISYAIFIISSLILFPIGLLPWK